MNKVIAVFALLFSPQRFVQFIDKVTQVYKERGEQWFREHNHHMDPAGFDSMLMGNVMVDTRANTLSFMVRFADPDSASDPLPFAQNVRVTCKPLASIEQLVRNRPSRAM